MYTAVLKFITIVIMHKPIFLSILAENQYILFIKQLFFLELRGLLKVLHSVSRFIYQSYDNH